MQPSKPQPPPILKLYPSPWYGTAEAELDKQSYVLETSHQQPQVRPGGEPAPGATQGALSGAAGDKVQGLWVGSPGRLAREIKACLNPQVPDNKPFHTTNVFYMQLHIFNIFEVFLHRNTMKLMEPLQK